MSQATNRPNRPDKSASAFTHRNRPVHIPDGYLIIGQIIGPHANRGEVKIDSHTDFPERFDPGALLLLGTKLTPKEILSSRPHKGHVLAMLEGINDRQAAEGVRGTWLFLPEADAAELDEDTFWIHDLLGLTVQTGEGRLLGKVTDVLATGANDVYLIAPAQGVNRGKEILLPAIAQVIRTVDVAAGLITVELLPGLLEEDE